MEDVTENIEIVEGEVIDPTEEVIETPSKLKRFMTNPLVVKTAIQVGVSLAITGIFMGVKAVLENRETESQPEYYIEDGEMELTELTMSEPVNESDSI